jgi:hypothetical protein
MAAVPTRHLLEQFHGVDQLTAVKEKFNSEHMGIVAKIIDPRSIGAIRPADDSVQWLRQLLLSHLQIF